MSASNSSLKVFLLCKQYFVKKQNSLHRLILNAHFYTMWTEKVMAPHSSILAWKIPWMEEPGRLQSMGSQRVRHDWVTSLACIGEGNGNPLQCSCLESPRDGGAWWAAVYGIAQSRTRLKQLSSSSSSIQRGRSSFSFQDHLKINTSISS